MSTQKVGSTMRRMFLGLICAISTSIIITGCEEDGDSGGSSCNVSNDLAQIQSGMTYNQVVAIMGPPDQRTDQNGITTLWWSCDGHTAILYLQNNSAYYWGMAS